MPEDEPHISYSLREVLGRLESKLDRLVDTLALKADRAELVELDKRVERKADRSEVTELDKRVGATESRLTDVVHQLQSDAQHAQERTEHRRWLWPLIVGLLAAIATILGVVVAFIHH
ncbi:hypothetical protein GCM10023196_036830 [Actinoallomurus vinaceus]|uniref:DUF1640 domain-containing protein n=1 Tax=Actinoallomurus vinaceus TaxID=1080074 RepID=A0ABP8U9D3_9ACTN